MPTIPFEGLRPARGMEHSQWAVASMEGQDGVALVIPTGFEASARLLHPLGEGERWADVAPDYLSNDGQRYRYPFPEPVVNVEGDMGDTLVDALVPLPREATTTPNECHYALWVGWGELHPGSHTMLFASDAKQQEQQQREAPVYEFVDSCPVQPWWGGRDMLLFDGPIDSVTAIGTPLWPNEPLSRRAPQWWWPKDRAWFVGNEIDFPWTYLGGAEALVERVTQHPAIESVTVQPTDSW